MLRSLVFYPQSWRRFRIVVIAPDFVLDRYFKHQVSFGANIDYPSTPPSLAGLIVRKPHDS